MEELQTLVTAAQAGNADAFGQIVRRFQDMAYASAYAMLGDAGLAQDVAQEAFFDAYRTLPQLRDPAAFPGWFRRIVFKHGERQLRGRRVTTVPIDELYDLRSPLPDPALRFEQALQQRDVHAAIGLLPPGQRQATLLYYIEGYSQKEIAGFLEITTGAVKKRLFAPAKP